VPRELPLELHRHYLVAHGGETLRPQPEDAAWAWAVRPVHGASSLLIPTTAAGAEEPRYLAFDYLIDQPTNPPVPPETWHLLVAWADRSQVMRIAAETFWRVRTAYYAAADSGAVDDVLFKAQAIGDRGEHERAAQMLVEALHQEELAPIDPGRRLSLRHQAVVRRVSSHVPARWPRLGVRTAAADSPDQSLITIY
jgi:hypothetical protein